MAGNAYMTLINGLRTLVRAVQSSAGAGDAGKIPALDATGRLSETMMPVGIGAETQVLPASENLAAGNLVNIWNDSGTVKVRKADASTSGKEANGFVLAAVTAGENATVYGPSQTNTSVTGLAGAAILFLDPASPGGTTATAPSTAGHVSQVVGRAGSATSFVFAPEPPVVLS